MKRFIWACALSVVLAACMATGEKYTVTYEFYKSPAHFFFTGHNYFAYLHDGFGNQWDVYESATFEICSGKSECWVWWFDGDAPATDEEAETLDTISEREARPFVLIGEIWLYDQELKAGIVDCERIDAPLAQRSSSDPDSTVSCYCYVEDNGCP